MEEVEGLAKKMRHEYLKQLPVLKQDQVAIVEPFIPSPVVNGYRYLLILKWNKVEANFGSQTSHGHVWGVYGFVLAV